jgi:hypothetical protein
VLKINQESEAVVQPGAPLIQIGDPRDLEIIADLLSSDAVQINPDASVRIDGWGGPSIEGRVIRIAFSIEFRLVERFQRDGLPWGEFSCPGELGTIERDGSFEPAHRGLGILYVSVGRGHGGLAFFTRAEIDEARRGRLHDGDDGLRADLIANVAGRSGVTGPL